MDIVHCATHRDLATGAADRVATLLASRPDASIALPTGNTPLGLYEELCVRRAAGRLALDRARFFNLDEYAGVGERDGQSFAACLRRVLFDRIGVPARNVQLLRGDAQDLARECARFDAAIAAAGGLDLAILGLGANGHIAFNEPGADWTASTHVAALAEETKAAYRRQTAGALPVPAMGITMGIATIRAARAVLLLVSGESKRDAYAALLRGAADPRWPVTSLLGHPRLTILTEVL